MSTEELELESSQPIYLTQEGHQNLKEELRMLTIEKRKEIAERIRDSKDHGEYSEDNSELDEVKIEQALVENRISELKNILSSAEILDPKQVSTSEVGLGAKVMLRDKERGIEFEVRIVASVEADPNEDLISDESPLGEALLGLPVGGVAEYEAPAGLLKYEVVKIRR